MTTAHPLRRVLRALLPSSSQPSRALVVQHLGFECSDLDTLPGVLDEVGRELGVDLKLDGVSGDVVLAAEDFVSRVAPQVLHAFLEERPMLTVARPAPDTSDALRRAQHLHAELVRQLQTLTDARRVAAGSPRAVEGPSTVPNSGFDSDFDSRQHADKLVETELDPDRAQLLNMLRRGLVDPSQPALAAGYGRKAVLSIDFATGVARVDELADQRLRVTREVPYLARSATLDAKAKTRDLDLVVWDIAVAAGDFRLLHSPVNWWHTPLIASARLNVARYTLLPQHLEMARCLAAGPVSPADLRRRCRVSLRDLRGFLQAVLFLGLSHWMPSASAGPV
jgi:hypothetical protein